jgi:spore maturation protein CgeB
MKILYIGSDAPTSTSQHRADALRRLGHELVHVNPRAALRNAKIVYPISTRIGFGIFSPVINHYLKSYCKDVSFDLAWLDTGAEVSPTFHRWLKSRGTKIINYNVDDPFGTRDGKKWSQYIKSVPYHDITAVVRVENIEEAKAAGAKKVLHVYRSYDPVAHAPVVPTAEEERQWASEVSFIGTWMPERGPFMDRLLELGVPLTIRGNRWENAPEWGGIKSAWKGPAVYDREYRLALQCSRVTLGLLSKGNRDLHTTRSAEVPFMGGAVFCAERTVEHQQMFVEGEETEFWNSPEECAEKCLALLRDEEKCKELSAAAKRKIEASGLSNDQTMQRILEAL